MRKQSIVCLLLFLFSTAAIPLLAQEDSTMRIAIGAHTRQYILPVNDKITTILIFPDNIVPGSVDRGSDSVIAKIPEGISNVLKIKSVTPFLLPTNFTTITTDGKVWSFRLQYSLQADSRPVDLREQEVQDAQAAYLKNRVLNDGQIKNLAAYIATEKPFLNHPKAKAFGIKARLKGIYITDDVIFYRIRIKNKTQIDYAMDFMRFYVRDKKRIKRTAEQEQELKPLFIYKGHGNTIAGKTSASLVLAFKKFTIADHKNFVMQLFEKNGDRNPVLKINGTDIVKARKQPLFLIH